MVVLSGQRQILLDETVTADSRQHVLAAELVVTGSLHVEHVVAAARRLVWRHSALRARYWFAQVDFEQEVVDSATPEISFQFAVNLTGVRQVRERELARPFDFLRPIVPRFVVTSIGDTQHHVLIVVHQVCCDHWALNLLVAEFVELYSALVGGRSAEVDHRPPQFHHYLDRTAEVDRQLVYWKQRLCDAPPLLAEVRERQRPAAAPIPVRLPDQAVRQGASRAGVTSLDVLVTAWARSLGETARAREVCVAVPVPGRTAPGSERTVGPFVNTVVLRLGSRFSSADTHEVMCHAWQHQDVPFDEVLRHLGGARQSPAQAMIALRPQARRTYELPSGAVAQVRTDVQPRRLGRFGLLLDLVPADGGYTGWLSYGQDLVRRSEALEALHRFYRWVRAELS
ncbi:condensation domain-containing protein [Kutzneria albida]|uniref:condensation domain-containing protein n=1 Tax=Kutzneria albida TaxID=43357 RepID=UPI00130E7851|nr:condensation domain-containing protein [Kutzneria albida]